MFDGAVNVFEGLFDALNKIILSFFFKVLVFAPALMNATLVGLGVGHFAAGRWGSDAGWVAGIAAALGIEAAGIILSWNLEGWWKLLIGLYVIGSWLMVWLGLQDGWLLNIAGGVMPLFAVATQSAVAHREAAAAAAKVEAENKDKEDNTALKMQEIGLARAQEETKQKRAEVKLAKQNFGKKMSKNEAFAWLKQNPATPTAEAANELGVTLQTVRNYRREMGEVQNGKLNELV